MLSPTVWEFKPKKSLIHDENGEIIRLLNNPKNVISKHYFIHLISVVLPDTPNIPELISNLLTDDCDYYKVKDFDLSDLISNNFMHPFITNGQVTALSIDNHLETDDCAAITPTGSLLLSLNKESFQSLGLEGKFTYSMRQSRYYVSIDLRPQTFVTENKSFQRIHWCLQNNVKKFTMLFAWKPQESGVCPSTLASYLSSLGYAVQLCKQKDLSRKDYNVTVPLFNNKETSGEAADLAEWLGMYSLGADLNIGTPNSYLSTYECPSPCNMYGQVSFLNWTGFFSHHIVASLCNELRKYINRRNSLPWLSLYVQCFADVPQSGEKLDHNGCSSYTIFLKPSGHYRLITHANAWFGD